MTQPLALANISWAEYSTPIRLPEDNLNDDVVSPPQPPMATEEEDSDDGTSLIDLLQRRDPLANISIRASLTNEKESLTSISELLDRELSDTSLLFSSGQGFPLHSALLSRSHGFKLLDKVKDCIIDIRNETEDNRESSETSLISKQLPSILSECYGGTGFKRTTRMYLLDMIKTGNFHDGEIKCGNKTFKVHQFLLAHRSDFFRAAFAHHQNQSDQAMIEMPKEYFSPDMFALLLRYCYTMHESELESLLANPDWISDIAFAADILMLPTLKEAALSLLCGCVDTTNAPSLLYVAEHLDHDGLRKQCVGLMVRHLAEVAKTAPSFNQFIGPKEYEWMQRLAEASASNPIACGTILTDEREYIGMLSEALDAQRTQHMDSMNRQAEEMQDFKDQVQQAQTARLKASTHTKDSVFHSVADRLSVEVEQRRARLELVDTSLETQARHIEFISDFLKAATSAPSTNEATSHEVPQLEDQADPEADPGEFVPTYEWQVIKNHQQIPAGLDIRVNINAGFGGNIENSMANARRARIPPVWRLKVWVEHLHTQGSDRYHRQDVKQDETTGNFESCIARHEHVEPQCVKLIFSDPHTQKNYYLDPASTFTPYLFLYQKNLRAVINHSSHVDQYEVYRWNDEQDSFVHRPSVPESEGEAAAP
mmetsp:Transcript_11962/g.14479  ORF Transcript_11962/g.14479 Transcript_11962/m.14479 type:complete len:654 (-) Transcript_11962:78-2039(-)|eukprot:CAMPEP_0114389518 /NCGR_PEP_ID=MMETSP0102-20121206/8722_1 /TAXON_ID=38822 ORGANISM="Pteridomonas danica, Strain PT" /NCGR_SAMPLE_ID=MMETSP0102 /ASSEMBLY_ACC=CAM_ASM_000212 /LENGTH=653 /DNA_ID=CAMNT_0001547465 /DNA_START=13 /DNA_END=1974 /DNA_ORIENTATION=-